ncbi:MAG: hypothetical protein ACE5EJ_06705 [Nitrosopumilaceae archaeon]
MNSKILVGGIVASLAIIIGIVGFSGSTIIDDVSGGGLISPSETPRQVIPLEIELEDISILEVTDRAATVEVQFKVTNPNFKSVILQLIKYELYENNVRLLISEIGTRPTGMVEASNYFLLLSENPTVFKDKVTIKNSGNLPELWTTLTNNTPQWKIKGEAFFNLSSMTSGGENEITFEFTK